MICCFFDWRGCRSRALGEKRDICKMQGDEGLVDSSLSSPAMAYLLSYIDPVSTDSLNYA